MKNQKQMLEDFRDYLEKAGHGYLYERDFVNMPYRKLKLLHIQVFAEGRDLVFEDSRKNNTDVASEEELLMMGYFGK